MMRPLILLVAAAAAAFAQIESNVVTVTASRQLNTQPDQVNLLLTVTTGPSQTLDTVLAALSATNITVANLFSVSGYGSSQLQWAFTLPVPIANLTDTTLALNLAGKSGAFSVNYYIQSSSQAAAPQCPYPALINDARAQAGKVAMAAGVTLGPIASMAQGAQSVEGFAGFLQGSISVIFDPATGNPLPNALVRSILASPSTSSCALTVQFQMGQ